LEGFGFGFEKKNKDKSLGPQPIAKVIAIHIKQGVTKL